MLFVINYDSEIRPPPPRVCTSPLTHPQLCLVFIFLCHILPLQRTILHFFPFFSLTGVEVKSLKQCMGWARREQTRARICLSRSGGGRGVGFLIKCFWILIWKGDGGGNKVKNEEKRETKSLSGMTFTRTEPPENKKLINWLKVNVASWKRSQEQQQQQRLKSEHRVRLWTQNTNIHTIFFFIYATQTSACGDAVKENLSLQDERCDFRRKGGRIKSFFYYQNNHHLNLKEDCWLQVRISQFKRLLTRWTLTL